MAVSAIYAFAEKDYDKAIEPFQNSPGSVLTEAAWIEPYDEKSPASPKGTLSWKDAAPWESNAFKPEITVKNTGPVALEDYRARLWFRVPGGKELYVPAGDWYTPVSRPSFENLGGDVWALDFVFDRYILYPGESVTEGNVGLHLEDWSAFDKTVCGMALLDSMGNVIYGKEPSISECRSYESSRTPVGFAWRTPW